MCKKYRKFATFVCLVSIVVSCLWLLFPIAKLDYDNGEEIKTYFIIEDIATLLVFVGIVALEVLFLFIPKIGTRIIGAVFSVIKGVFFLLLLEALKLLGTPVYTLLPGSTYLPYTTTITAFAYIFLVSNGLSLLLHIVALCLLVEEKRLVKEVSTV